MSETNEAFQRLVLNGVWEIGTNNGEFLDVAAPDGDGTPPLTSSPVAQLRHCFRFRKLEPLSKNKIAVWAEPVSLVDQNPNDPLQTSGYVYPFVLRHDGCSSFFLDELPKDHELGRSRDIGAPSAAAVDQFAVAGSAGLAVGVDALSFLNTFSGIGFPVFTGKELRAFTEIAAQLGFDPHSPLLTLAALQNTKRPETIPQEAWDAVLAQLRTEIDYRDLCRLYFGRVESFVQNVFISNAGLVDNVGAIVQLDKSDTIQILLNAAFGAMAKGVGGLGFTGAGVVSGALTTLFEQLAKDKGPSATEFAVALAEARSRMSDLFDYLITIVQDWQAGVFADWGRLSTMGQNLKSGEVAWPDNDEAARQEAKKQLEISLYRDLVKVRWRRMESSDSPRFYKDVDFTSGYIAKNKNYWLPYRKHTQTDLFGKETQGYLVNFIWLGRGATIFDHKQPDDRLPIRLFNELGVPRETVFTEWGLTEQTFIVQKAGPFI